MENPVANLQIDGKIVSQIVEKTLATLIASQLSNPKQLVEAIVRKSLDIKVDGDGKIVNYNGTPLVDYEISNAIREKARELIKAWVNENSNLIIRSVEKELKSPGRAQSIARAFLDCAQESIKSEWRFNCDIRLDKN